MDGFEEPHNKRNTQRVVNALVRERIGALETLHRSLIRGNDRKRLPGNVD